MLDFLGIGAQKSGTTWLYEMLSMHPAVRFPAGKEVHFWDINHGQGLGWYRSLFAAAQPGLIQGEITPAYAILPPATIKEIYRVFPDVRLCYLIRNPLERAWSSALMALGRAEMVVQEASDQWFIDHFQSAGSLSRGDYETCLRNWRACYPAEQLLVMRFEDLRDNPLALLERCCVHLAIDPAFYRGLPPSRLEQRVFSGSQASIRPALAAKLRELYAGKIHSLAAYLGEDLNAWLESPAPLRRASGGWCAQAVDQTAVGQAVVTRGG